MATALTEGRSAATSPDTQTGVRPNHGPFATEQEALDALVERLVAALDPQAIWLFGSRARRDHRPDSDFDLLVVAKPEGRFGSNDYEAVYMAASGLGIGRDIVPCSAEDFSVAQLLPTTLVSQVIAHGRKLFEAQTDRSLPGDRPTGPAERALAKEGVTR
jgi:hypothetical protein